MGGIGSNRTWQRGHICHTYDEEDLDDLGTHLTNIGANLTNINQLPASFFQCESGTVVLVRLMPVKSVCCILCYVYQIKYRSDLNWVTTIRWSNLVVVVVVVCVYYNTVWREKTLLLLLLLGFFCWCCIKGFVFAWRCWCWYDDAVCECFCLWMAAVCVQFNWSINFLCCYYLWHCT